MGALIGRRRALAALGCAAALVVGAGASPAFAIPWDKDQINRLGPFRTLELAPA